MNENIDIAMEETLDSLVPPNPPSEPRSPSREIPSTETPTSLYSSPSIEPATLSWFIAHGEQKPRADTQGRRSGSGAVQGSHFNTGSQRNQPRSNTSPSVTGARAISRVEKKAGKRRGTTNDQSNDGDDPSRRRGRPPKGNDEDPGPNARFACPFFKKNRVEHFNCSHFQLRRVKDVKQHIFRKHPFHCSYCFEIFPELMSCEEHMGRRTCGPDLRSQSEAERYSISDSQKMDMTSRATIGRSETNHWFNVWEILFPDSPPPTSPYLGSEVEEGILMVRELLASNGLLALENLNSTVNLGDGALNNMLASCNIKTGSLAGNTAGRAIGAVDLVLQSLSVVTTSSDDFGSPSSAFWGAELSDLTPNVELPTAAKLALDVSNHDEIWCQTPRLAAVQTDDINDQAPTELDLLSQTPYQPVIQTQNQPEEAAGIQIEGLVGIDAILSNPAQIDVHYSSNWEDYLIESRDMSFADDSPYNTSML